VTLLPGIQLGPYEIVAPIGAGGMGEVYRARDGKLKREVAIKVLPAIVAADAARLARFQREAEVLASLNHPHVAAIYGLEEFDGHLALVMELVEGEDLSVFLARGSRLGQGSGAPGLQVSDALPIARQIADALDAAHEHNIIHRDLKPANVRVRPDGVVKVLDFGLARTLDPELRSLDGSDSPTLTSPAMTQAGMILGTAAYMAPEQARGRVVDKRADIWAFGAVLFEMLTGLRAFPGEDVTDTIVSVVSKEPDWSALPASTPAALRRLIGRCLKKDPKTRLRDIGEARVQIDDLMSGVSDEIDAAASEPAAPGRAAGSRALPWILAASAAVLALISVGFWAPWRSESLPTTTALQLMPLSFEPGGQSRAVWSPDGKAVAFGARQSSTEPYQIYVRYLDSPVANRITSLPTTATLVQWTTTGRIVFHSAQAPEGFWSVSPVGGQPEPLMGYGALVLSGSGSVSVDGTAAAALFRGEDDGYRVYVSSPIGTAWTPYEPAPFASRSIRNTPWLRFSPDGRHMLLNRNGGSGEEETWLLPYPASPANPPRRVALQLTAVSGTPTFSWMPDNRRVVLSVNRAGVSGQLYLGDTVTGEVALLSSGTAPYRVPAVSPDGTRVAFVEDSGDYDIVSADLTTAAVTPVIVTQRSEQMPAWAMTASALVYVTDRNGTPEIWLHTPGQPDRPLVMVRDFPPETTRWFMAPILSPDASRVIYARPQVDGPVELWMSAVAGGPPVRVVKPGAVASYSGSWSPDGDWFVYWSFLDGQYSLYKVKTTGQAEPEGVGDVATRAGTFVPVWSPGDNWILYADDRLRLISPDGKTRRELSARSATAAAFSADGRTVFGVRTAGADRVELFSIDVDGGAERTIGFLPREYLPAASVNPSHRMTLAPDGQSVTWSKVHSTSNLWLMEGLQMAAGK
jgi:serine/threonine protein kinase